MLCQGTRRRMRHAMVGSVVVGALVALALAVAPPVPAVAAGAATTAGTAGTVPAGPAAGPRRPAGVLPTVAPGLIDTLVDHHDQGPDPDHIVLDPAGLAVTGGGLVVADTRNHVLRRFDLATRVGSILAGNGSDARFQDAGPVDAHTQAYPGLRGVWAGPDGVVHFEDLDDHQINHLTASGAVTSAYASGTAYAWSATGDYVDVPSGFAGSGSAAHQVQRRDPGGVTTVIFSETTGWVDGSFSLLHATDAGVVYAVRGRQVFRVVAGQPLVLVAGNGGPGPYPEGGSATGSGFGEITGITTIGDDLYIADGGYRRVRRVDAGGLIHTVAGTDTYQDLGDGGPAAAASFARVAAIAAGPDGSLYVSSSVVRRIRPDGVVERFAGLASPDDGPQSGPADQIPWAGVADVLHRPDGHLLVADGGRILDLGPDGSAAVVVGGGSSYDPGAPATQRRFFAVRRLAAAADGSVLFTADAAVFRLTTGGAVERVAGEQLTSGAGGDGGPALDARLGEPTGVAVDAQGRILVADTANHRVRRIALDGTITTIAGGGASTADGVPATSAQLARPTATAVGPDGTVFVADSDAFRVKAIDPSGTITTVAGSGQPPTIGGSDTSAGDGGPATAAHLARPVDLAVTDAGLLISDAGRLVSFCYGGGCSSLATVADSRVRIVLGDGRIETLAGRRTSSMLGDGGPAKAAWLSHPTGLDVLGDDVVIADTGDRRVRRAVVGHVAAPTGVQAVASPDGSGAATVTWTAPVNLGLHPVTGYEVTRVGGGPGCSWTSGPLSCTVTGLAAGEHAFVVRAVTAEGPGPGSAPSNTIAVPVVGPRLVPVAPTRIVDSRSGTGTAASPWGPASARDIVVAGGGGGAAGAGASPVVPAQAVAVVMTVTIVRPSAPTHLTVWPTGSAMPVASSLNAAAGTVVANTVVSAVGTGGAVSIFNNAGSADVLVDVTGYFVPGVDGGVLRPTNPTRIVDTREGMGTAAGPFGDAEERTVVVAGGATPVPAGASAVVATVTVVAAHETHVSVSPTTFGGPAATSNVNVPAGRAVANTVVAAVGAGGTWHVYNSSGPAEVIIDVTGWFEDGPLGATYHGRTPTRIVDSRESLGVPGPWAPGEARQLTLVDGTVVPAGAGAVVVSLTGVGPTAPTHLSVSRDEATLAAVSNLNVATGEVRANTVVVPVDADGRAWLRNNAGTSQVVVDVVGWFA